METAAGILIKTPEQIEGIRKSCVLASEVLDYLAQFVIEGVSTNLLDKLAAEFIRENGATSACLGYGDHPFPKSICTSINEVVCHGIPSDRLLDDGDIINIDVTTILGGYFGDTSRMFAVGRVAQSAYKLMEVTARCLEIGIEQVRPGNRFGNIGYEIAKHAELNNFSVVRKFVGHGVGVKFHEPPQVVHIAEKDSGEEMLPGMIFTIEPMINEGSPRVVINEHDRWTATTIDKKLSAQYEHTVLVTESGHEILTKV
jgi:methionyl aminopeptidase